jgi:DNA-binding CsgD family transcriptional regulator
MCPLDLETALGICRDAHDAGADERAWREVLRRLVEAVSGVAGGVAFRERAEAPDGRVVERASQIWVGLDREFEEAYMSRFWPDDPWAPAIERAREGRVLLGPELVPEEALVRGAFYNELCRPHGYHELLAGPLVNPGDGSILAGIGVLRPHGAPAFGEEERGFLELVAPHIRAASDVARRAGVAGTPWPRPADAGGGGAAGLIDRLPIGAVVVDASGRALRTNAAVQRIFKASDGLRLTEDRRVDAAAPADARALGAAIAAASGAERGADATDRGERGPGARLLVRRPSGRAPYAVTVAPAKADSTWARACPGAAAVVWVVDPNLELEAPAATLRRLYALTEAESRIARLVGMGRAPRDAARELGISWNTARVQLHHVYAKTGVDRQAALARLLVMVGVLPDV